jgi:hypothetical protein
MGGGHGFTVEHLLALLEGTDAWPPGMPREQLSLLLTRSAALTDGPAGAAPASPVPAARVDSMRSVVGCGATDVHLWLGTVIRLCDGICAAGPITVAGKLVDLRAFARCIPERARACPCRAVQTCTKAASGGSAAARATWQGFCRSSLRAGLCAPDT